MPHFRNHFGYSRTQEISHAEDDIDLLRRHSVDELKRMSRDKCQRLAEGMTPATSTDGSEPLLRSPSTSYSTLSPSADEDVLDVDAGEEDDASVSLDEEDEVAVQGLRALLPAAAKTQSPSAPASPPVLQGATPTLSPSPSAMASPASVTAPAFYFPPFAVAETHAHNQHHQHQQHQHLVLQQSPAGAHQQQHQQQLSPVLPGRFAPSLFVPSTNDFDRNLLSRFRGPL